MLNQEQTEVVQSADRNIVVVAVPGSGKTRTLIATYEARIKGFATDHQKIALVTYTTAAAAEMTHRIKQQNLPAPGFVGTLHSLMLKILRREGHHVGVSPKLAVIDDMTATRMLQKAMKTVSWRDSVESAKKAVSAIRKDSTTKDKMLFHAYHDVMIGEGLTDFDGILYWAARLFAKHPGCSGFTHLFVDEFQDISDEDAELLFSITGVSRFYVGDPRQAIFGFRGGNFRNLTSLIDDPEWADFSLSVNYRSTPTIVAVANSMSPLLPMADRRILAAKTEGPPGVFDLLDVANEEHQIDAIVDFMEECAGTSMAIICRYNWQISAIAEELTKREVKHMIHGARRRPSKWTEVGALVAFLANPASHTLAYSLAVATMGQRGADNLSADATAQGVSLGSLVWSGGLPQFSDLPAVLKIFGTPAETANIVMAIAGKIPLVDRSWAALSGALMEPDALVEVNIPAGVPVLCTIHASKGREWDTVMLPYWSDQLFPGRRGNADEEARLAYVAITRARTNLSIISPKLAPVFARGNAVEMERSRFVAQILKGTNE